jgi:hypothetical protein
MNSMVISTSPAGQTLMSRLSSNVKFSSEKTPPLRNRTAVGQALACDIVMGTCPAPAPRREWAEVESLETISWNRSPRDFTQIDVPIAIVALAVKYKFCVSFLCTNNHQVYAATTTKERTHASAHDRGISRCNCSFNRSKRGPGFR